MHPQLVIVCALAQPPFILELFLHSSPVASWAPTDLGTHLSVSLSFCLFLLLMGFSRQECWSGLPFPSPVDHILSELSIMTHPSWVSLHCMAHSFTELHKAVIHVIILVSFLWFWFSFCWPWDWRFLLLSDLWWLRIRGLCKVPDGSCGKDWVLLWWAGPCSVNL